jgi:cell division protease FtsH
MVGRWGMSDEIGTITVIPSDGQGPLLPGASEVSPRTQEMIDDEVRKLVAAAHEEVVELLRANRDKLESLAQALLEHETLDQPDAYAAAGVDPSAAPREPVPAV